MNVEANLQDRLNDALPQGLQPIPKLGSHPVLCKTLGKFEDFCLLGCRMVDVYRRFGDHTASVIRAMRQVY